MAKQTKRSGTGAGQKSQKSIDPHHQKLSGIGDAPASGEPRETGRSRGHLIDPDGTPAGKPRGGARKGKSSKDSATEAPESGRQDAMA